MASFDLPFIDRTAQETGAWIDEIAREMGRADNRQLAYHAFRGVMFAVRDRVPLEENFHLASQMPALLRGVYFEGYRPAHKPETYRDPAEFLGRVSREFGRGGGAGADPGEAAEAVMRVLARRATTGEVEQIRHALPAEIRALLG